MYQQYQVHKDTLDKTNPAGTQNERILWHGTAPDTIDKIIAQGFNRSFCGKNGKAQLKMLRMKNNLTCSNFMSNKVHAEVNFHVCS